MGFGAGTGTGDRSTPYASRQIVDDEALWRSLTVDSDVEVVDEV